MIFRRTNRRTLCTLLYTLLSVSSAHAAPAPPPLSPVNKKLAALYNHAGALLKKGRKTQALTAFENYIETAGKLHAPSSMLVLGYAQVYNIALQLHRLPVLMDALQHITTLAPQDMAAAARLAQLAAFQQDSSLATKMALRVLAHKPAVSNLLRGDAEMALGLTATRQGNAAAAADHYLQAANCKPADPQIHYDAALSLLKIKKYAPALAQAQKVIALIPSDPGGYLLAAAIQQQASDLQGAAATYTALLKKQPGSLPALFNLAFIYQQLHLNQKAVSMYEKALSRSPHNPGAHFNLGTLFYEEKNYPAAAAQFEQANGAFGPKSPRVAIMQAQTEMQCAMNAPNIVAKEQCILKSAKAFQTAQKLDPGNQKLVFQEAQLYALTNHFHKAMAIYRGILAHDPSNRSAVFGISNLNIMLVNLQGALQAWHDYLVHQPRDVVAYQQIASLYERSGLWQQAADTYKKLLLIEPQDGDAVLALANDYVKSKQPQLASEYYNNILALNAQASDVPANQRVIVRANRQSWHLTALQGLADIARTAKHYRKAIHYLHRAEQEDITYEQINHQQVRNTPYQEVASLYLKLNAPQKAIDELQKLAKLNPLDSTPWVLMSPIYEQMNQIPQAVQALQKAGERDKTPLRYSLEAAALYQKYGEYPQALSLLQTLPNKYQSDPDFLQTEANIQEAAGKEDDALATLTKLQKLRPWFQWIPDKQAAILTHLKRYQDALAIRLQQLKQHPDSQQTYADIGHIYSLQNQNSQYLQWLQTRLQASPANSSLIAAFLDACAIQKQPDTAGRVIGAIEKQYAAKQNVMIAVANALQAAGQPQKALPLLKRLANANPSNINLQNRYVSALDAAGEQAQGNAVYTALLAAPGIALPKQQALRLQLISRLQNQNKLSLAARLAQQALALDPINPDIFHTLATLLNQQGHVQQMIDLAKQTFHHAGAAKPLQAMALSVEGAGYLEQHNIAEARVKYNAALKLFPGYPPALDGIQRLNQAAKPGQEK